MKRLRVFCLLGLFILGACSGAPIPETDEANVSSQAGLPGLDNVVDIASNSTSVIITGNRYKNIDNFTSSNNVFIRSFTANLESIKFAWDKASKNVPSGVSAGRIALDSAGNSYAFRTTEIRVINGILNSVLRKYSPTGALLWEKNFPQFFDVAVDSTNNVYLLTVVGIGINQNNGNPINDIVITKISTAGVILKKMASRIEVAANDDNFFLTMGSVKVDAQGTVYASYFAGAFRPAQTDNNIDFGLLAFDASGTLRFNRIIAGAGDTFDTNNFVSGNFSFDSTGNIFVAAQGNKYDFSCYNDILPCGYTSLGTTLYKLDRSGKEIWQKRIDGDLPATAPLGWFLFSPSIMVDKDQTVYVAGEVQTNFPGQINQGGTDIFAMKLNASGNRLWVKQFGTSGIDGIADLTIKDGLYVAGLLDFTLPQEVGEFQEGDGFLARIRRSDGQNIQILTIR